MYDFVVYHHIIIVTWQDNNCIHLIRITLFNREVTPPHCSTPGEWGHRREASGGVSEEGQQAGGAGAEAGAETWWQGPDSLPQQVGGPGQDQPPQEEPTGIRGLRPNHITHGKVNHLKWKLQVTEDNITYLI